MGDMADLAVDCMQGEYYGYSGNEHIRESYSANDLHYHTKLSCEIIRSTPKARLIRVLVEDTYYETWIPEKLIKVRSGKVYLWTRFWITKQEDL